MEQESWSRNHGGGIILEAIREEESWRRHHGRNPDRGGHQGGLMGEESWMRNHEMESTGRHPAGTSTKQRLPRGSQKAPRRHPGGTQESPRRHPGDTQEAPRHQGAPRRHPGGTQEAPRKHPGSPGHPGGSRRSWEQKGDKTIVFYHRKWRERPFRVHETSATLTKYRKLQQIWAKVCANVPPKTS